MKQAKRGGEVGMNSEFYRGGQFLPNTELPKMSRIKRKGTGRQQIEPFKWEVAPEGRKSLYGMFSYVFNWRTNQFIDQAIEYYRLDRDQLNSLYNRWLSGERWVLVSETLK